LLSFVSRVSSLSVTVNDVECVYEYVIYEGDTVSGNFVVVDHDIFWGSDHPGIDLIVRQPLSTISVIFLSGSVFIIFLIAYRLMGLSLFLSVFFLDLDFWIYLARVLNV